jgi:hypothetical protein
MTAKAKPTTYCAKAFVEFAVGTQHADRAIQNNRVKDPERKIAERKAKCEAGDHYSCGVLQQLELKYRGPEKLTLTHTFYKLGDKCIWKGNGPKPSDQK